MFDIPGDKVLHFVVSLFLTLIDPLLAVVAGVGKEVFDFFDHGEPELGDLAADLAGIVVGLWTTGG
jgi:hypothetical protein